MGSFERLFPYLIETFLYNYIEIFYKNAPDIGMTLGPLFSTQNIVANQLKLPLGNYNLQNLYLQIPFFWRRMLGTIYVRI